MGHHPVVVGRWVTKVGADCINTMLFDRVSQRIGCEIKRFVPFNFYVLVNTWGGPNTL